MTLSEICIKRPVLATVMSLILIVFGCVGYHYLSTRYLPKFETARINVFTSFPGASPSLVESLVTTPLEDALRGVSGIETVSSTSSQNSSKIHIHLSPGADKIDVTNDIRNKIAQARFKLPSNINPPVVSSGWEDGDFLDVAITSSRETPQQVYDYIQHYLLDQVEDIDGIASSDFTGATDYVIRAYINPQKLAALHLPITDVTNAITAANVNLPAGSIKGNAVTIPLDVDSQLSSIKDFNALVIAKVGNTEIHLSDVGTVKLESLNIPPDLAYYNGKPALYWQIYNTTDGNPIEAAHKILKLFKAIKPQLPTGMKIHVLYNQAQFMQESISEVYSSLGMAVICVMLVLFLFLGTLRASLIPMVTIPVCIIATFGVIYSLGFTINIITLLALVLAIGLVVDDAIVVLENIYRHIENGLSTTKAALVGAKEITFAVIAMTLTLAAVYAPIGLVHGRASTIFQSFAFTLAAAVLISGFVALTLTPMMCAKWLSNSKHSKLEIKYHNFLERFFQQCICTYQKLLSFCLNQKWWFVLFAILIASGGFFLFKSVPKAFTPEDDQGLVIAFMKTSKDVSPSLTRPMIHQAQNIIDKNANVANSMAVAWASGSFNAVFIQLNPLKDRKQSSDQVANQINTALKKVPGLTMRAFASSFGGNGRSQLEWMIQSTESYKTLAKISEHLVDQLNKYPGLTMVTSGLTYDQSEYKVHINRNLANALGVSIQQIDQLIAVFVGGQKVTTVNQNDSAYDVYVQAKQKSIEDPNHIGALLLTINDNGKSRQIPLSELITIKRVASQDTLSHYNHLRSAQFDAQLSPGYSLGQTVSYLQTALPRLLPSNTQFSFKGKAKNALDSSHTMNFIFLLAFIFIYLVLSALFESFLDPLVILLVVPLSIVAALLALKVTNSTLNIYTDIGLVTLIGLIAKHGILITQFANKCVEKGDGLHKALLEAGSQRLRPILMTTAAMIFGALPLVFAGGSSAQSRFQIGLVIIAGLFFGTFFSLILVPVFYALFKGRKAKAV
jgi:hydrophobe/amphiphile efflux-1 (HAE1) family protein